uniref:Putative secreted peptide n=1 Tax=Anopheles braziliensis TaxID=58242 RepID=A0A2M3ZS17_9DIPT
MMVVVVVAAVVVEATVPIIPVYHRPTNCFSVCNGEGETQIPSRISGEANEIRWIDDVSVAPYLDLEEVLIFIFKF